LIPCYFVGLAIQRFKLLILKRTNMTTSLTALAALVGWILALLVLTLSYRGAMVMTMKRQADAWTRGRTPEDNPFFERAVGAYANSIETAALFVAVILLAHVSGQSEVTDGLAMVFVAARVVQSLAHMISVGHWMIFLVRFPAFMVQVALLIFWLLALTGLI
jgi:uncharacterized MAPEG superfamily protein